MWNDGAGEQDGSLAQGDATCVIGLCDMADKPRDLDFSSWEHMLADGGKERQEWTKDGTNAAKLVKSRP
jgi:hypothetical protein